MELHGHENGKENSEHSNHHKHTRAFARPGIGGASKITTLDLADVVLLQLFSCLSGVYNVCVFFNLQPERNADEYC